MLNPIVIITWFSFIVLMFSQCEHPQKAVYISYNAMSQLDTLSKLFEEINHKNKEWNLTFEKDGIFYSLTNLVPHLYHNSHYQIEKYRSSNMVDVQLGHIYLGFSFNYSITKGSEKKNGYGSGRAEILPPSFVKSLKIEDDGLHWKLEETGNIYFGENLAITYSEPTLSLDEKKEMESIQMLNSEEQQKQIISYWNDQYKNALVEHLATFKEYTGTPQIIYSFKNSNYTFINHVKSFKLTEAKNKGLEIFFDFGLKSESRTCIEADFSFYADLGGMQELYLISSFRDAFHEATKNRLLDTTLDKTWNVQAFQFYMGDLSASVPEANKYDPETPITVECKMDQTRVPVLNIYGSDELYAEVDEVCRIIHNSMGIIEVKFRLYFVLKMHVMEKSIKVKIDKTNIEFPKFKSINPNFEIKNQKLLEFQMSQVLSSLVNQESFGSNWSTVTRKFPAVFARDNYQIALFDASQN